MAYTPPNVFVAATNVSATALQGNTDALRKYINRNIIKADVLPASVTTTDVIRGEYANVVRDHQFTSGDVMTNFIDTNLFQSDFFTSTWKMYDQHGLKTQQIPQLGKRIVMERDGSSSLPLLDHLLVMKTTSCCVRRRQAESTCRSLIMIVSFRQTTSLRQKDVATPRIMLPVMLTHQVTQQLLESIADVGIANATRLLQALMMLSTSVLSLILIVTKLMQHRETCR